MVSGDVVCDQPKKSGDSGVCVVVPVIWATGLSRESLLGGS